MYVEIVNEAVPVWRPVKAVTEGAPGVFRIVSESVEDEEWAFPPGSVVRCEYRDLSGGRTLVATELVAT
jgi:hypothetical protein